MLCGRPFPEYIKILELRQIDIRRVPDIGKITVAGLIVDSGCFKSCLLSGLKRMSASYSEIARVSEGSVSSWSAAA